MIELSVQQIYLDMTEIFRDNAASQTTVYSYFLSTHIHTTDFTTVSLMRRFRSAIPKVRYSESTLMKNVIPEEEPDFHIHTGVGR